MIDDSKIRLRYNILFMKPQSCNTATTFKCDLLNEIRSILVIPPTQLYDR